MEIQIEVQEVSVTSPPGKKYKQAEIAFKNLGTGKFESKKLMSFTFPEVFNALSTAQPKNGFAIEIAKNDRGYWDWTKVAPIKGTPTGTSVNSNDGWAEREATKQVMIVRQTALKVAAEQLAVGSKTPPVAESVIDLAQFYVDWVLGNDQAQPAPTLLEMADDFPE